MEDDTDLATINNTAEDKTIESNSLIITILSETFHVCGGHSLLHIAKFTTEVIHF